MDNRGTVLTPEQVAELDAIEREARGLVSIPGEDVKRVKKMNRKARLAWRERRKAGRLRAMGGQPEDVDD